VASARPSAAAGSEALSNLRDIPRPFVIEPPADDKTEYIAGEELAFRLVLVGRSVAYLPYFVTAFRELGRTGIGRRRAGFELVKVSQVSGAEWLAGPGDGTLDGGQMASVFDASLGERVTLAGVEDCCIGAGEVTQAAKTLSPTRIRVEFLTMTRLKHSDSLRSSPAFHVLVTALLRRVSSLAYFHHGVDLNLDYSGLVERAKEVRLAADDTRWVNWTRYSNRQDRSMNLGGLVGGATYEGEVAEFRELLVLGSVVHVGKNTTFGLGQYRLNSQGQG